MHFITNSWFRSLSCSSVIRFRKWEFSWLQGGHLVWLLRKIQLSHLPCVTNFYLNYVTYLKSTLLITPKSVYICAFPIVDWWSVWKQTTKYIKNASLLLSFKDRTAFCDWLPLVCLLFCWHHLLVHSSCVLHILIFAGSVVSEPMLLVSEKDFHCCQLEVSQRFQAPATKGWQEHDTSWWVCIPDCCLRQGQHSNLEGSFLG